MVSKELTKKFEKALNRKDWDGVIEAFRSGINNTLSGEYAKYMSRAIACNIPASVFAQLIEDVHGSPLICQAVVYPVALQSRFDLCEILVARGVDLDQALHSARTNTREWFPHMREFLTKARKNARAALMEKQLYEAKTEITALREAVAKLAARLDEAEKPQRLEKPLPQALKL